MASYEQKPGDIIVFKNRPKDGGELHPNAPVYTGNGLDLQGNPIRVALWVKDGANGKFFAGNIEQPRDSVATTAATVDDEDLPF